MRISTVRFSRTPRIPETTRIPRLFAALILLVVFTASCAGASEPTPEENAGGLEEEIVIPEDLIATFDVGYEGPSGSELDAEADADADGSEGSPPQDLAMTGEESTSDPYLRSDGGLWVSPQPDDRGRWETATIVDESGTVLWSFSDCDGDTRCTHGDITPLPNGNAVVTQVTTDADGQRFDRLVELEPFYGERAHVCAGGAQHCTGVAWQSGIFEVDEEAGFGALTNIRFDEDQRAILAEDQGGATVTIPHEGLRGSRVDGDG